MTTLTSGRRPSFDTRVAAREISGLTCSGVEMIRGLSILSGRQDEFTAALLRIQVIGLRALDGIPVISPATRMQPGYETELVLIQNLIREIDRAEQLRSLL